MEALLGQRSTLLHRILHQKWSYLSQIALLLLLCSPTYASYAERVKSCSEENSEGKICSLSEGKICKKGDCVSACELKDYRACKCPDEADDYCYLCCGSHSTECQPAHRLGILRPNGEYWERDTCRRCRTLPDGLQCDDTEPNRLCHNGRCSDSVCNGRAEGAYCDMREQSVCVDYTCYNPCQISGQNMLVCECSEIDPRTGMASNDRCQLCCFDFTAKKCLNAYEHFGIKSQDGRPIARTGLSCRSETKTCNKYGICAAGSLRYSLITFLLTFTVISLHILCQ